MATDPASLISVGSLRQVVPISPCGIFDESRATESQPIVQCVQIKPLAPQPNGQERYRAVFSDISNYVQTMIATLRMLTEIWRILIILDLEVLSHLGEYEKIGDPKPLETKPEDEERAAPTTVSGNSHYGSKGQVGSEAHKVRHASSSSSSAHATIYPIEAISPYSHKWTIKARCTSKSAIKTWHRSNSEGKLFSVNLLDDSGEIKATGFNDQCDMFYDMFQEGSVYYISSPCRVQIAKKQFSNLNNDYELTFEKDTIVEKAEDQDNVPQIRFNFTSIGDLQSVEKDTTTDIIGVIKEVGQTSQITSKTTNKPYDKRDLLLVDNTGFSVRLTVWGNVATNFSAMPESVVAFKGVKVSDFGDIEEAHRLKGWYDAQGRSDNFTSHASMSDAVTSGGGRPDQYKTIAQIREEQLGMSEEADFFSLKATIIYIKQDNVSYPACPSAECNKKVSELDPGQWRCEKCDKTYPKPEYRYIMLINVSDHTGQLWLNCFDEVGRLIMGKTADDLVNIKAENEYEASELFQEANCQTWNFRCKAKMDHYGEQQRIRYQISYAKPINYSDEATRLANLIQSYSLA
ncbi:hypothetical protein UA08_09120 [Talaromyces atroroseus]|uniref:Replication protein A subunit n=1 Tax=Talaromyces atroroseus TaxID=1441469 RepID=A0A1Q5Q728_TALAT|nr:hypothetical protein UA08_09120 [Talaromyces atroroseus]OKL55649.1 hypothetical protein UA08_09120 [Talaromyces atroroseus]